MPFGLRLLPAVLIGVLVGALTAPYGLAREQTTIRAKGRICGSDAYTCSVEMSRLRWAAGTADNVYLGVAGDPALTTFTRPDGPLLLVHGTDDRIPYVVYEELVRLGPHGVIAVGAVHDDVLHEATMSPADLKAKWDAEDAEGDRRRSGFGHPYEGTIAQRVARCESHENPTAKNRYSSASGLYQFIDGTWRSMSGQPPPARAYPAWRQTEVFWKTWDGGKGSFHWNPTRRCWS